MKTAWDAFLSSKAVKWMNNHTLISASVFFTIVVLVGGIILVSCINGKKDPGGLHETLGSFEASEVASEQEETVRVLEYETNEDIHNIMTAYYEAVGSGNQDKIKEYLPCVTEMQLKIMTIQSSYLEKYDEVKCYTQKGLEDGSFYVYVTYHAKFKSFDVAVPAIDGFYLLPKEGGYDIYRDSDMTTEVKADCAEAYLNEDVQKLYDSVKIEYNKVVDTNPELATFVNGFEVELRNELARQIAIEENNKILEEESTKPPVEEPTSNVTDEVIAKTTVNVRSSDSENGDRLGKVGQGTKLTRLEERINGWSKIIYEGKEAYIKTEYLEVVEGSAVSSENKNTEDNNKYVTTTTGVNLREKADEKSKRVALAETGTKLELVEELSNGWTKVKYNGKEAYVKSDFVN